MKSAAWNRKYFTLRESNILEHEIPSNLPRKRLGSDCFQLNTWGLQTGFNVAQGVETPIVCNTIHKSRKWINIKYFGILKKKFTYRLIGSEIFFTDFGLRWIGSETDFGIGWNETVEISPIRNLHQSAQRKIFVFENKF